MKNEMITASFNPVYNTCVEYWGENKDVLSMLRLFDLWEGTGRVIEDSQGKRYCFELSKEFFEYMMTDNFRHSMLRIGIDVAIYDKEG